MEPSTIEIVITELVFVPVYDVNSPTIFRHAEDRKQGNVVVTSMYNIT